MQVGAQVMLLVNLDIENGLSISIENMYILLTDIVEGSKLGPFLILVFQSKLGTVYRKL